MSTGANFFCVCVFNAPPPPAVLAYILSREGFGCPFPPSTMKSNFVYSRSVSACCRFWYESEKKKKHFRRGMNAVTWSPDGCVDTTRPPGRPACVREEKTITISSVDACSAWSLYSCGHDVSRRQRLTLNAKPDGDVDLRVLFDLLQRESERESARRKRPGLRFLKGK